MNYQNINKFIGSKTGIFRYIETDFYVPTKNKKFIVCMQRRTCLILNLCQFSEGLKFDWNGHCVEIRHPMKIKVQFVWFPLSLYKRGVSLWLFLDWRTSAVSAQFGDITDFLFYKL